MFITPAVADGLVFVGSCSGKLLALADSTGAVAWSYDTSRDGPSAQFHGDMLVAGDFLVVPTDTDSIGHLYAFQRATGVLVWRHLFPGGVAAQVVARGSTVLAMTGGNEVAAVDIPTGRMLWRVQGPPDIEPAFNISDPALVGDRFVVAWRAGWVDAFDAGSGKLLWRKSLLSPVNTSIYAHADTLAVGTLDGLVHRLRVADGTELGRLDVGGMPFGDIVPAGSIALLLTKKDEVDRLTAWTPDFHRKVWEYAAPKELSTFRPEVSGGDILTGYKGRLVVLDRATGTETGGFDVDGSPRGLAWLDPRTCYVGLFQGSVLRLEDAVPDHRVLPASVYEIAARVGLRS